MELPDRVHRVEPEVPKGGNVPRMCARPRGCQVEEIDHPDLGAGDRREQIGVINFFNLAPSRAGAQARHIPTRRNFRFDAMDAVRQLHMSGDVQPSLVFDPTTGLTSASAETVKPEMNAQANVHFQSARLVSTP